MSMSKHRRSHTADAAVEAVAGNGLLHRRALLGRGLLLAGAVGAAPLGSRLGAAERPLDTPLTEAPWSLVPGAPIEPYQRPSRFEHHVVRTVANPTGQPGAAVARTPHHLLNGTITPNGCISSSSMGASRTSTPTSTGSSFMGW